MLQAISRFFRERIEERADADPERSLQLACAALLIEVSRADLSVDEAELKVVEDAIVRKFGIDAEQARELVELGRQEAARSTSDYDFVRLINEHFDPARKHRLVELFWEVAYADGVLDKYEEHLVRHLAELLHIPHRDFIALKLKVQERRGH